jgi:hypothetical protein
MYSGEVAQELELKVLRKKEFSAVKLARVSDMNSSLNPSGLGAIASLTSSHTRTHTRTRSRTPHP